MSCNQDLSEAMEVVAVAPEKSKAPAVKKAAKKKGNEDGSESGPKSKRPKLESPKGKKKAAPFDFNEAFFRWGKEISNGLETSGSFIHNGWL